MPTYEYACTSCGERTEAKQSFTDPPLETCPVCGGKLRKLFSPVGIVFKGSGFYATDAKKKSSSASSSAPKSDKSTKSEGSEGSSSSSSSSSDPGSGSSGSGSSGSGSSGSKSSASSEKK